jgi:single-strand DNA-binding protein
MTFATITQSGILRDVTDYNERHAIALLEIEPDRLSAIINLYGKFAELAHQLKDTSVLVSGNLSVQNRTFNIDANNLVTIDTPFSFLTVCGRLGMNPSLSNGNGKSYSKSSLAFQLYGKDTSWLDFTAFGKKAEIMTEYCQKGSIVAVTGRIQVDEWTKQTGEKISTHKAIVNDLFLMPRSLKQEVEDIELPF